MNILFIDTSNSGLSGDMFLASLLGLVPDPESLINKLLNLKDFVPDVSSLDINLKRISRSGLNVNQLEIKLKESKNHRSAQVLNDSLNNYLDLYDYSYGAKLYANKVLNSLIEAESYVHDKPVEHIHLHELSSVDTLIDILGVTKALDLIGIFTKSFKILYNYIPVGGGSIKGAHGILPIPAPATMKIIEDFGLKIKPGPIESELLTPTGAALIANLNPKSYYTKMIIDKTSYGTGQKTFTHFLNVLRLSLDVSTDNENIDYLKTYEEPISVLETNVDDVSGEIIGNFIKIMEQEDILDIQILSGISKKNRMSYLIRILCHPNAKNRLIEKLIEQLGTLGVRFYDISRICVNRRIINEKLIIEGKAYPIDYKISFIYIGKIRKLVNIKPEFDHLRKISEITGINTKILSLIAQEKSIQLRKGFLETTNKLGKFNKNKKEKKDK